MEIRKIAIVVILRMGHVVSSSELAIVHLHMYMHDVVD